MSVPTGSATLDDENLTVTSLHATPGKTVEAGDERELTLETLEGGKMLKTWISDNGFQYLELRKSPSGYMGSTRLVEYVQKEPYMRVQQPPGAGTNTSPPDADRHEERS